MKGTVGEDAFSGYQSGCKIQRRRCHSM